jgi:hypothetical protein
VAKEKPSANSSGGVRIKRDSNSGRLIEVTSTRGDTLSYRTSPKSVEVIKESANVHRDALKRLVDR